MDEMNVINRIKELCEIRGWSYYRLSKESEIPQSTLNNMFTRTTTPTVPTLKKLCDGFGITLSEFFSSDNEKVVKLTAQQKDILEIWSTLDVNEKRWVLAYVDGLKKNKVPSC